MQKIVISSFLVISSKNPLHSVLFLILSFVTTAWLFILLGAEFFAMILIVVFSLVYVLICLTSFFSTILYCHFLALKLYVFFC